MPAPKNDISAEQKILEAAKKVFIRDGMMGARMQDIADEAGINKALLHYYFRSKEKLFDVIFLEAAAQFFPRVHNVFEADLPLFEKIESFCENYIEMISHNPYLPMFILAEINRNPQAFMKKVFKASGFPNPGKFLMQIDAEIKKGTIKNIGPMHLFMNILSMCIFPFIAKPIFQLHVGIDEIQFRILMEQRKKEIPRFVIDAIKK
jgi:AcrR family transcriptional regulator